MSRGVLNERVLKRIDERVEEIIGIAMWRKPELGYKEFETAKLES